MLWHSSFSTDTEKRMAKDQSIGAYQDPHDDLYAQIEDRRRRHLFGSSVLDEAGRDMRLKNGKLDWTQQKAGNL